MDQAQQDLTLDESIKQVMQTLPPLIRAYLAQGKYTGVAKSLMAKYGLRIDQGGVLEREIMLLLMGIENPDEFTQALVEEARLDQKTISSIVQDINVQIFIPLREEEMRGEENKDIKNPTPANPRFPQRPQSPTIPVHLENKISLPPKMPTPVPPVPEQLKPMPQVAIAAPKPNDEKLLEDHEEAHIEFNKSSIPPNLPGAMPPRDIPVVPKPPAPQFPKPIPQPISPISPVPPPPTIPSSPPAPVTSYTVDPYREPIDIP